jgi:hypothetical protein
MTDIGSYSLRPSTWPWDHDRGARARHLAIERALRARRRRAMRHAVLTMLGLRSRNEKP